MISAQSTGFHGFLRSFRPVPWLARTPVAGTTNIRTFAERDGDEYVVSGAKVWTTEAPYCEMCLLFVRTTSKDDCANPTDASR